MRRSIIIWNKYFRSGLSVLILILVETGCNLSQFSAIEKDANAGYNGSFEITKSNKPANWYVYLPTLDTSQAELFYDTVNPHQGKQSLMFKISNCSSEGGRHSPGIFQEMSVQPGSTYLVSFWIKNQGCKSMIRMDSFTAGTEDTNHPKKWLNFSDTIPEWQRFDYEFTLSKKHDRFRLELNILSAGTIWIDDVSVEMK